MRADNAWRNARLENRVDDDKVQRILKAWDYGVEIEHMEERFGLSRSELVVLLRKHGRRLSDRWNPTSPKTINPGTRSRTGRWGWA